MSATVEFDELVPLHDRVVIREDKAASRSKGGIEIPEDARKPPARGTVLALGPEVGYEQTDATQIKIGSRVVYSKYSGTSVRLPDGSNVLVLPEKDIYAIIKDGANVSVDE